MFYNFAVKNHGDMKIALAMTMKRCLHGCMVCLVMGIAFAACSPSVKVPEPVEGPSLELSAIDSLMWRQPDSALAQLQRFAISPAADSLDEFNGHYCQLLVSELLYKNYKPQSNRDELLQAVDYFDSIVAADEEDTHKADKRGASLRERNVFLDARAHYINGAGYYDQGDVMNACAEYLKALELMEGCYEGKALIGKRAQFMANTCNRLGDLFSEQFMMESSITCYENALVYCKISPTSPTGVSNILYRIGKQYDKMNEIEKAQSYYDQALENMAVTDNMVYRNIVASKALCDYKMKEDVTHALDELNHVLIQANTENERLNRSLTIGGIFFYENNYDSALKYLEPVYENLKAGLQKQAASYLYIIYDLQGNRKQADSLMRFLTNCKKPEGENKALVSKLEDMYKNYSNKKLEKQTDTEREIAKKKVLNTVVPIAIAVALAIFCVLIWRNRRQLKHQQKEADKALGEAEQEHEKELRLWQAVADKTLEETEKKYEAELEQLKTETKQHLAEAEKKHQQWMADAEERHSEELRTQKDRADKEMEKTKKRHDEELEAVRQTHQMQQAALSGRLKRSNEELRDISKRLELSLSKNAQYESGVSNDYAAFINDPICKHIVGVAHKQQFKSKTDYLIYKDNALSKEQLLDLRNAVQKHLPRFVSHIRRQYPKLTDNDMDCCYLVLLGLNEADISAMMQRAYTTVCDRSRKISRIIGTNDSLYHTLRNMLDE